MKTQKNTVNKKSGMPLPKVKDFVVEILQLRKDLKIAAI
jgi:hypothetical protein